MKKDKADIMNIIINNENSFKQIVDFLKICFESIEIVEDRFSKLIVFENRDVRYSIRWNSRYCTLFHGDLRKNEKTSLQYTFSKIKLDDCYPIEVGNNYNVVFWNYEITNPFDDISTEVSPLRVPINNPFKKTKEMKTPYLNSLIAKLNLWEQTGESDDASEKGLTELLEIQNILREHSKNQEDE